MTHIRSRIFKFLVLAALAAPAQALAAGTTADDVLRACAAQNHVTGRYRVQSQRRGGAVHLTVLAGDGMSERKAASMNACIARASGQTAVVRTKPNTTGECLAEYRLKMRASNNRRQQIIEHEYDRCLTRIAYLYNRCPYGVFRDGAGYCIRRPYR